MQPSLISHPPGKSPSQSWSLPPPSTQHRRYSTRQEERKLPPHISHLTAKRALKRRLHKTPIALPFRFLLLFPHLRSQGRHFPPRIMYISCRCRATIRRKQPPLAPQAPPNEPLGTTRKHVPGGNLLHGTFSIGPRTGRGGTLLTQMQFPLLPRSDLCTSLHT